MQLNIQDWAAWVDTSGNPVLKDIKHDKLTQESSGESWPVPETVPKAQRRRLTPFAKMVLSQLEKIDDIEHLPTVFSTRHGDLPKTIDLLKGVATKEDLSPTQFALSVHNAVSGQFGIYYKNQQPSNVVSAGKDTFAMGLIDAVCRLSSSVHDSILLIHADMPLPEEYMPFADEAQLAHCVVIKLSKGGSGTRLNIEAKQEDGSQAGAGAVPQAIEAVRMLSDGDIINTTNGNGAWVIQRA